MEKDYGNVTLSEIADFTFNLLGSFWSVERGIEGSSRASYLKEDNKTDYSRYNLCEKSDLSEGIKFFKNFLEKNNANSLECNMFLDFPLFLTSGISKFTVMYSYEKNLNMQSILIWYLAAMENFLNQVSLPQSNIISEMIVESYKSILKESPDIRKKIDRYFEVETLLETANWAKIKDFFSVIKKVDISAGDKSSITQKIIRHYVFLGFKNGLKKVFQMQKTLENTFQVFLRDKESLVADFVVQSKFVKMDLREKITIEDPFQIIWYLLKPKSADITDSMCVYYSAQIEKFNEVNETCMEYFVNDLHKVDSYTANIHCKNYNQFNDEPSAVFYQKWFQARTEIFKLQFDDSEDDKLKIDTACKLFKEAFDHGKYLAGQNIKEFLVDAIVVDCYFNSKALKDVIDNNQDNTKESSIKKPSKTYWEFGFAIGVLPVESEKTYLIRYNKNKNFWAAFTVKKFFNEKNASNKYFIDMVQEEIALPGLIENFAKSSKVEHLLSKETNKFRQPLTTSKDVYQYTNLNIAIMSLAGDSNNRIFFPFVENFIKKMPLEIISKHDSSGCSSLIRVLYEYKCCKELLTWDFRQERSGLLLELEKNCLNPQSSMDAVKKFVDGYSALCSKTDFKQIDNNLFKRKAKEFKKIAFFLIEKFSADELLTEAIQLETKYNVSALQLAIEISDLDLVKVIVGKLVAENKDLSKIYISERLTTPLQYAILKYDYLMQDIENLHKTKMRAPLKYKDLPFRKITTGGILNEDLAHSKKNDYLRILSFFPWEENGFSLGAEKPNNLIKIIRYLAQNTNPISVDTMYYLADQDCFTDVINQSLSLLDTGNVDVAGTNWEYDRGLIPQETLLSRCIRNKNWCLFKEILFHPKAKDDLKKSINRIVSSYSPDGILITSTDVDFSLQFLRTIPYSTDEEVIKSNEYLKARELGAKYFNEILSRFCVLDADFTIKDNKGKTVIDYLRNWLPSLPTGSLPKEILALINNS